MPLPQRKQRRLPCYDYAQDGVYFITICTEKRRQTLGCILQMDGVHHLSLLGKIALDAICDMERRYGVMCVGSVVMPNHIHLLIALKDSTYTVSQMVGGYKSTVSNTWLKQCKDKQETMGTVWQESFHDHVVRNQEDFNRIYDYIQHNIWVWHQDKFYEHPL